MEKDIFKFSEDHLKQDIIHEHGLIKKLKYSFNYLLKYIPINEINSKFSFKNVNFLEGKSYNWFFLVKEDVKLLVRQYGSHFTIICSAKEEDFGWFNRMSVFTIGTDRDKMDGETSDAHIDNHFLSFNKLFPSLLEHIQKGDVGMIWNNVSLVRPKYVDVKLALVGESCHNLDLFLFACEEVFSMHCVLFAENEMAVKVGEYNVGDTLGKAYTITEVRSKIDKEYYYNTGLSYTNNNFKDSKASWSDVYSLTRYHYSDIFPQVEVLK